MKRLPDEFLFEAAAGILSQGRRVKLIVGGDSMWPFLHGGKDCVVLEPVKAEHLVRGAIVLFRHRGQYVLHRFIGKRGALFCFCGDGNYGSGELVSPDNILGMLQRVEHPSGCITYCTSRQWRILSEVWMRLHPVRKYIVKLFQRL